MTDSSARPTSELQCVIRNSRNCCTFSLIYFNAAFDVDVDFKPIFFSIVLSQYCLFMLILIITYYCNGCRTLSSVVVVVVVVAAAAIGGNHGDTNDKDKTIIMHKRRQLLKSFHTR